MERVNLEAYLANPVGRSTGGEGWLHFCTARPLLAGATIWGTLGARSCESLLRCMTAAPERHALLLDGQRMSSLDAASFALAIDYVARHRGVLRTRIVRLDGVWPLEPLGAVFRGSLQIPTTSYPATLFSERLESLRWLDCEHHAAMIDGIESLVSGLKPDLTMRQRLAQLIYQRPTISREEAANTLGMSLRSLQRRVREEGSTFQDELAANRVLLAQRHLMEGNAPLAQVAVDVGFNSPAIFSIVFRKLTGKRPSEWREARRKRRPAP